MSATDASATPWWHAGWGLLKRRVITSVRPVPVFLRPGLVPKDMGALVVGHGAALIAWREWCQAHAGSHCQLALSAHWLLSFATPSGQVASSWEHYFGLSPLVLADQWLVRSTTDRHGVSVVCAAPKSLIQALQVEAREHGVKIAWVGPWWAPEVQAWLGQADQADHWSAREPGLVTHVQRQALPQDGGDSGLSQVWSEVLDAPDEPEDAAHSAAEALVAAGAPHVTRSTLVDQLDFVGPRVRTAVWSWAFLVMGFAAALAVADQGQQITKRREEAQQTLSRLVRAQHQQQLARIAPRAARESSAAASSVLSAPALHQASGMVQLLAFPWSEVIEHVEQAAAQEQAVLTAFSLDLSTLEGKTGAQPSARLVLAVRDDAVASRWLTAQGDDTQLLSRQALSTPFDTVNGHYALRYDAAWAVDAVSWRGRP